VISKQKQHNIQVISDLKMREILQDKKIIPYGEELNEEFVDFLSLNDDFDTIIMLNKFRRSLIDM